MAEKILSIIIPVYNTDIDKIKKCINSISKSYNDKIEIIIINDGSTKENTLLYDKIFSQYKFLTVYYQDNQGVSKARNLGVEKATGKYISFLDSDDKLNYNLNEVTNILENNDYKLLVFNFLMNGKILCHQLNINNLFELSSYGLLNPIWNKIYLKEIIKIDFNKKISLGEDLIFNLHYIIDCDKFDFAYYPNIYSIDYLNDDNNTSLTKKYNGDEQLFFEEQIKCINEIYKKNLITKKQFNKMVVNSAKMLIGISSRIFNLDNYSLKEQKEKYRSNKKLIFKVLRIQHLSTVKDYLYFLALVLNVDEIKYINKARKSKK